MMHIPRFCLRLCYCSLWFGLAALEPGTQSVAPSLSDDVTKLLADGYLTPFFFFLGRGLLEFLASPPPPQCLVVLLTHRGVGGRSVGRVVGVIAFIALPRDALSSPADWTDFAERERKEAKA